MHFPARYQSKDSPIVLPVTVLQEKPAQRNSTETENIQLQINVKWHLLYGISSLGGSHCLGTTNG
jgi:hypothetical protein